MIMLVQRRFGAILWQFCSLGLGFRSFNVALGPFLHKILVVTHLGWAWTALPPPFARSNAVFGRMEPFKFAARESCGI